MSDQWIFFPCQMGENRAFIFFDHGIRENIDTIAPRLLLKVRLAFKQPRSDGMPGNDEFPRLKSFEDALQNLAQQHESVYVGRITVDGHRHFYIYTTDSEEAWSAQLDALGQSNGYELAFDLKPDEQRKGYWDDLFPTDDDWQVINDLRVIETVEKHGDDGTASRCIEHWAYFLSAADAETFAQWVNERGYRSATTSLEDNRKHSVRFSHTGTLRLQDITSHTIALRRKASELGGDYDGWETPVCKPSA